MRETWEEIMSTKFSKCGLEQNLVGTQVDPGNMCLSCFEKYKILSRMHDELLEKAGKALAKHWLAGLEPRKG